MELRKDIEEMAKEKEIVAKRIERMQRKARQNLSNIFGTPNIPRKPIYFVRLRGR